MCGYFRVYGVNISQDHKNAIFLDCGGAHHLEKGISDARKSENKSGENGDILTFCHYRNKATIIETMKNKNRQQAPSNLLEKRETTLQSDLKSKRQNHQNTRLSHLGLFNGLPLSSKLMKAE